VNFSPFKLLPVVKCLNIKFSVPLLEFSNKEEKFFFNILTKEFLKIFIKRDDFHVGL